MKYFIRLSVLSLFTAFTFITTGLGQGYQIEAHIKGIRDSSLILGHYSRSNTQFVPKDTAKADADGNLVFKGTTNLPGGLYVILFPGNRSWVELVYSGKENNFSFTTDTLDVIGHMKVKNSKENELFYTYQNELNSKAKHIEVLRKQNGPDFQKQLIASQEEFKAFRQKFLTDNTETFTVKLLKMSSDPEIPAAPKLANGKSDSIWVFNYYKSHYWDDYDFSDIRIMNTPFLEPRLDRYFKNLVVQVPDSIIKDANKVVAKASANKDIKSFVVYYITNQYENPKTVGTEAVWVHMAQKYYLTGEMGVADDIKKRIAEKVDTMKDLLVNKTFPALTLTDPEGKKVSPQALAANYTVLFFYAPTCGHCKEASPKLKAFYDKNKANGIKVMAISTEHDMKEWKSFITTYHLEELVNGFDALKQIDFNRKFDVVTTPTIYILDKNKKIIARKMPVEQLEDFLNYYQNKMAKKI
ncbi:TlpA family protein disulfide reductase [Dyadobacter psychrotolerans]|uniref:Redoxin domain-containing protein n=1 Tax=Dyadobacter psychrotolerans TaxID=2541721 RepID=A0A4R5DG17_9BACT|nr:TlpA family protein disulfide reductase [Dyadobacter psychrotolerans]TDE12896.1 redoxin domain-containing protein [Dyadobacter psychrotolerans]